VQRHILDRAHQNERLAPALAQRHRRHRDGRLVLDQLQHRERLLGLGVEHADAAGPLAGAPAGHPHHSLHQHALGFIVVGEDGAGGKGRGDAGGLVELSWGKVRLYVSYTLGKVRGVP
jgi:hypothetical protein